MSRGEADSLEDIGDVILGSVSHLAGITPAKNHRSWELKWWANFLEASWVVAFGRSRFLCGLASSLLHITILLLFLIHWPSIGNHHSRDVLTIVPIELVTIADETNIEAMVKHQLPFLPSNQQVEPTASSTKPESASGLEMKLFPPEPSEQSKTIAQKEETGSAEDNKKPSGLRDAKVGDYDISKVGPGTAMTMSMPDFLLNQIAKCWRHTRSMETEIVVVELFFDGSGSIERPPRLIVPSAQTPSAIAAEESVRHAIYTCAPYRLPAERYQQWRQITLTFNPKMLRGGVRQSSSKGDPQPRLQ